jgi:hypothetical protein
MAATTAERQRAFRQRQTERIATLKQENTQLSADLAAALAVAEWLASMAFRRPAGAIDGGTCQARALRPSSRAYTCKGARHDGLLLPISDPQRPGCQAAQFVSA